MPRVTIDGETFDIPGDPEDGSLEKKRVTKLFRRPTPESIAPRDPSELDQAPPSTPDHISRINFPSRIALAVSGVVSVVALAVALHAERGRTLLARLETPRVVPTPGPRYDERDFPVASAVPQLNA